jgi:hypothetical protein
LGSNRTQHTVESETVESETVESETVESETVESETVELLLLLLLLETVSKQCGSMDLRGQVGINCIELGATHLLSYLRLS